ncbi:hypothetical protein MLD38_020498 [Melastoma candidum]|uniref:Uncharacterized protein n=1 Tax=Melastoma candidum TaxID=119954 RepID=A0ACB9QG56_9MYRT|nr:hypothetical protein MLD38_020498 [Melastoma candidum]
MSGPQCCSNPPALNLASGGGRVEIVGGLDAYVVGPSESKLAVVLVSDIFGFEAPKLRKLADKVASAGFYVVVPDFMHGEPYDPKNPERPIQAWRKDHGTDKGLEEVKLVIEALKSKGIAAVGAAGFCWGAKVVVGLAMCELVQAAVLLHPSLVTIDDIKGVKVPIAVLGAENDHMSPPELVKQFEDLLAAKPEVDAKVKIFPKVSHGWTVRYEDGDEFTIKSAKEAHEDMIGWFAKYVK